MTALYSALGLLLDPMIVVAAMSLCSAFMIGKALPFRATALRTRPRAM